MKVARWAARLTIQIEEALIPTPADDQALVRVVWTGLCGSDLEEYQHGPVVAAPGVVLGHEIVGVVATAARDGSGPAEGIAVVVDVVTGCGRCYWCQRHEEGLCPDLVVTGHHVDGGLAEYVVGRASRLIPVPAQLPLQHAALAEPAAVAVRAIRKLGPMIGRSAVVVGGGTVGLLVAQVAKNAGADTVLVVEPSPVRRAVAGQLGLDAMWDPQPAVRARMIAGAARPQGIDVVIECSGARGAAREAVHLTRPGGTTALLGVATTDAPIDELDVVLREKTIIGSSAHMWDDDVAVAVDQLATGRLDVTPLISSVFPLEHASAAFALLAAGTDRTIKVLVACSKE